MNAVDFRKKQTNSNQNNTHVMATNRHNTPSPRNGPRDGQGMNMINKPVTLDDVLYGDFTNRNNKNKVTMKFDDIIKNTNDSSSDTDNDKKAKKKNNKILTKFLKQEAHIINISDF
jgi:hypothetical protein